MNSFINTQRIIGPRGQWLDRYTESGAASIAQTPKLLTRIQPYSQTPNLNPIHTTPLLYHASDYREIEAVIGVRDMTALPNTSVVLRLWAILGEHPRDTNLNDYILTTLQNTILVGKTEITLYPVSIPSLPNIQPPEYTHYGYGKMELYTSVPQSAQYGIFLYGQLGNVDLTTISINTKIRIELSAF